MRVITNTNIIVDDFGYCKSFPKDTFVHFLTHFHADHWDGLTPLWDYSLIYCTNLTAELVLNKFPKLAHLLVRCEYYKEYSVDVAGGNLAVKFWMFDAKHIPGAAMILFQGYMGRILFTGDFRYQIAMILENPILFPLELRQRLLQGGKKGSIEDRQWVESQVGISLHIDQMVFDNTYCNQMFDFGCETQILQKLISIIDQHPGKKVLIALGALGKNRILFKLSEYYQTLICVSEQKMRQLEVTGSPIHIFTTNPEQAVIEVIKKRRCQEKVQSEKSSRKPFICINTDFLMVEHNHPDGINFIVPYSIHSNYNEMCTLVKLINPSILQKLVIPFETFKEIRYNKVVDNRLKLAKYLDRLEKINKSKSGYSHMIRRHTDIRTISSQYMQWMYPDRQDQLMKVIKIGKPDHSLRKKQLVFQQRQQEAGSKLSLRDIASQLRATHNNRDLTDMFNRQNQPKQSQLEEIYNSIFS